MSLFGHTASRPPDRPAGRPPDDPAPSLSKQCLLLVGVIGLGIVAIVIFHRCVVEAGLDWYFLVLDCVFDTESVNTLFQYHCDHCGCDTQYNRNICAADRFCHQIWPMKSWMLFPLGTGGMVYFLRYLPAMTFVVVVFWRCYSKYIDWQEEASERGRETGLRSPVGKKASKGSGEGFRRGSTHDSSDVDDGSNSDAIKPATETRNEQRTVFCSPVPIGHKWGAQ